VTVDSELQFVSDVDVQRVVSYGSAIGALDNLLRTGTATEHTPLRVRTELPYGHLLYMPSQAGGFVGMKMASVSPGNAARGLPRIQGLMILSDAETLEPLVVFDAQVITVRKTAALSALAVRYLATENSSTLVLFGTGPQAWGHVEAIRHVRSLQQVIVIGRSSSPVQILVDRILATGLDAEAGTPHAVAEADIVACCTSASNPLFDSSLLREEATVVAIGSHSPGAREVDASLVRKAVVVVESRHSAFAEAGDILLALQEGVAEHEAVNAEVADLVTGPLETAGRPRLFKGVGEAWADVAVATLSAQKLGLIN